MDENRKNSFDWGDFFIGLFVGSYISDAIRKSRVVTQNNIEAEQTEDYETKKRRVLAESADDNNARLFMIAGFLLQSLVVFISIFIYMSEETLLTRFIVAIIVDMLFFLCIIPPLIF